MTSTSLAAGAFDARIFRSIPRLLPVWLVPETAFAGSGVLLRWNSFGLLDSMVAVSAGTVPLSLIPTFSVPCYLILLLMIFLQYRGGNRGY
ncbi:MAG: hypothetical protein PVH54_02685 [Gammaproteobacteria bacterium]|jgi:hypothetical protein